MSSTSPPIEAQRFGRSQTPESPRPVHIPEPANIPVLMNQMDPVFNDTATYNIPDNQSFSPYTEHLAEQGVQHPPTNDQDAVQNFFREAENQAAAEPFVTSTQSDVPATIEAAGIIAAFPIVSAPEDNALAQSVDHNTESALQPSAVPLPEVKHRTDDQNTEQITRQTETGEQDTPDPATTARKRGEDKPSQMDEKDNSGKGVDYQSLLDTITQSASTAPSSEGVHVPASSPPAIQDLPATLPSVPGLPPKPPPQANPVEFPSFVYTENAQVHTASQSNGTNSNQQLQSHSDAANNSGSSISGSRSFETALALNEHAAKFNAFPTIVNNQLPQSSLAPGQIRPTQQSTDSAELSRTQDPTERPWTPRTQTLYDQFLDSERRYVTEGIWDKFPMGSRLFVGNLPSEKVTKRDLFHRFHRHGQLAQISIKQAYGFVQYLEAESCSRALAAEQGVEIRGRKVHLEVSKPQKNTRNAGSKNHNSGNASNNHAGQNQTRRRSRSPDRNRRNYSDYRDEPGRRSSDHRNRRSPSPRGYRARDEARPSTRDRRSRSPLYANYAPLSLPAYDEEANLPLPRRDTHGVPDVQVLILEPEVAQSFINWVEQSFRLKGLQASTIWLNHRLPLGAVVKRQIIEGVQAVVKLTRAAQNNSKIPLQVFDRTAGASNVNFNEYVDLDLQVAADVVLQARAKERAATQPFQSQSYQSPPGYAPQTQFNHPQAQPQYSPSVPPPYQQQSLPPLPPQYPYTPPQPAFRNQPPPPTMGQPPNLQQLLANLRGSASHQDPSNAQSTANSQPVNSPYSVPPPFAAAIPPQNYGQYGSGPAQGYTATSQGTGHPQQNMQNIMDQLARYQR